MVIVKIEIWPLGKEEASREIDRIIISNQIIRTLKTEGNRGDYSIKLLHAGKYYGKEGFWKKGIVKNFRRMNSPYHLIRDALLATIGDK